VAAFPACGDAILQLHAKPLFCDLLAGARLSRCTDHRTPAEALDHARRIAQVLPPDAWIAGQFAPTLCLDNGIRTMYVQKGLANEPNTAMLINLPITHVLATEVDTPDADPWATVHDDLIFGPGGLRKLQIAGKYTVDIYANKESLP
jgi:hypothetical protein